MNKYDEVIEIVEKHEVCDESDKVLQQLAEEMDVLDSEYRAIRRAAELCVENPAVDNTGLGRLRRMSNIFSQDELDAKIGLLIDVIFTRERMPA